MGLPYMFRAVWSRISTVKATVLAEAAETLGSPFCNTVLRVVVPSLLPGILSGSLLVFSLSLGEFTVTQLTAGGSLVTFPIYMQTAFQDSPAQGALAAVLSYGVASGLVLFATSLRQPDNEVA